jgi:tRNA threonylcarbamoyladenosine biosynthesis protein TsaE
VAGTLAAALNAGDVVLLSGISELARPPLSGDLREGLGVDPGDVSSPTFTLVHEYRGGRLTLYHVDLYRLDRAATEDLGLEELGVADGVLGYRVARSAYACIGRRPSCSHRHRRRHYAEDLN